MRWRFLALLALVFLLGGGVARAVSPWSGCDFLTAGSGITILCPNSVTGGATITNSGVGSAAAPGDARYWTSTANVTLTSETDMGALTTGLVMNTVAAGVGTPSTYAGTSCTNQFVRSLDASGAATCATVTGTDLTLAGASCTNQFVSAITAAGAGSCTTATLASAQFANQGTATTVLHGNAAGNPSFGPIVAADMGSNTVTGTQLAVVQTRRVCAMIVGADNATAALADADLGPQGRQCFIPAPATVVEVNVAADAGTPNIIPRKNSAGSGSNLVSSALATAAAGGIACSNTGGTTGLNGVTTCSATLQNTSLAAGDYLELISGTAGGTAKRMSVFVIYTIQ
jgi:hypothetical protein